jgi:hypothetical protein
MWCCITSEAPALACRQYSHLTKFSARCNVSKRHWWWKCQIHTRPTKPGTYNFKRQRGQWSRWDRASVYISEQNQNLTLALVYLSSDQLLNLSINQQTCAQKESSCLGSHHVVREEQQAVTNMVCCFLVSKTIVSQRVEWSLMHAHDLRLKNCQVFTDFSIDIQKVACLSQFSWGGMSSILTALVMNKPDWPCYHLKFYNKYFSSLASILKRKV